MDRSFGSLLRQSRLASFDRTLPRVYTTPKKLKGVGHWGLKRNLPTVINTPNVTISNLDTPEHQTPWRSGETQVMFLGRWKENFPNSEKPRPRQSHSVKAISQLSSKEFKRLLTHIRTQAPAFQEALKDKTVDHKDYLRFLGLSVSSYQVPPVGPTYSDHDAGWQYPVQGRILHPTAAGYAVGIAGVVAHMSRRDALGLRNSSDRSQRTFYIQKATFDEEGRPFVSVGLAPRSNISLDEAEPGETAQGWWSARPLFSVTHPHHGTSPDESSHPSEPNQTSDTHTILMERISSLLESGKIKDN